MAGAVFNFFVVGEASLTPVKQNKTLAIFFQPFLKRPPNLGNKSVYDPNFATFFVISTLIFCSLCLLFLFFAVLFFVGGLSHKNIFCSKISSIQSQPSRPFGPLWRLLVLLEVFSVE